VAHFVFGLWRWIGSHDIQSVSQKTGGPTSADQACTDNRNSVNFSILVHSRLTSLLSHFTVSQRDSPSQA
jgi:hypothetical protein